MCKLYGCFEKKQRKINGLDAKYINQKPNIVPVLWLAVILM